VKLRFERALLPEGIRRDVTVEVGGDGRIIGVTPGGDSAVVRGLALPGMPNLHSHAFQRAMAGSAEVANTAEHSFWGWREVMYRFVERLAPEDLEAIAAFAYLEMLEAGYTQVAEFHYVHHDLTGRPYPVRTALGDAVRAGAAAAGIRHVLLPTLYQQGSFDGQALAGSQLRFANTTDGFLDLYDQYARQGSGLATTGIALHSLRAVPREVLVAVTAAVTARDASAPVHIHVAEQQREVRESLAFSGRRPVEYLLDSGVLSPRWCLVHATHVTAAELSGIAASGAVAGICPTTEGNLGDGRFPLDEFLAAGGRFGIGSDSHVSIDPREELRSLEYTLRAWREQRVVAVRPDAPHCGTFLYRAALAGGAQACGEECHGLQPGAPADIVLIDTDRPEFAGVAEDALVDATIFAPRPGALQAVWVGGRQVVSAGCHHARATIVERYRASLARLTRA
jgi:formimidoylglutamate deiminase